MQKFYLAKNEAFQKNFKNLPTFFFLLALLFSNTSLFAQTNPVNSEFTGRLCVRKPVPGQTQSFNTSLEAERERRKAEMSISQRNALVKHEEPFTIAARNVTESVFLTGTLSLADPTYNRNQTHAQGGTCLLSAVGTATHYKTHTFTLAAASNVTISVDPVDGGSISPANTDTYIALYGTAGFIPSAACTNSIMADDDGGVGATSRIVTTTPLAPGTYTVVVTSFDNTPTLPTSEALPWNYTLAILYTNPSLCSSGNILNDPSFEATDAFTLINPSWPSTSTNFGSSLCDPTNCGTGGGTAGPRTGNFWAWFGGISAAEIGTVQQSVVIPTGAISNLNFYLRIGSVSAPFDATLKVMVDGITQVTYTEPPVAEASYTLRTINLSAFADGNPHTIRFEYNNPSGSGISNFNVDDVTLDILCSTCTGTPTAGTITGAATGCNGTPSSLTLTGYTVDPGVTIQWKSATVSGGPYTNIPGATNATYNFTATPGIKYYIATLTCISSGLSASTLQFTHGVGAPAHSAVSSTITTLCSPGAATITGTVSGGLLQGSSVIASSGAINLAIPDNTPAGANSSITLPATTFAAAADLKIRINARHSWVGDLKFTLTSPCGVTFLFDRPGVPASTFGNSDNLGTSSALTPPPAVYTFDLSAATVIPETFSVPGFIPTGSYKPSDAAGAAHTWAGLTFPCSGAGTWTLNVSDAGVGDVGVLVDWQILGPPVYTHTLTGPGTITQNPSTGVANATANFTVTNLPGGIHNYILTSTDAVGCPITSFLSLEINPTPVITIVPAAPVICNGAIQPLTATALPPTVQSFSQGSTIIVPAGSPAITTGIADPYPSQITVSGLPTTGVSVKSVKLGNINHTFPDDVDVVLVSPTGQSVILMSDAGGGAAIVGLDYTFDDAAATTLADASLSPQGSYKPTNFGSTDNFPAPGPGSLTQASPTLASFTGNQNGAWKLYVVDDQANAVGYIGNWSIDFNIAVPVTFSPLTNLFTDAAATIPYTGTPVIGTIYSKSPSTITYTASATRLGCTGTATVTVTVNQLPAITTQPTPATQTVCPGSTVTYSVAATGTGITYQWRRNGVALVNGLQLHGTTVAGATTNTLTLTIVSAPDAGNYDVVIAGTCPPNVTSTAVALVIASAPIITTQPANVTSCIGGNATISVGASGTPTPTIYQWQVSTTAVPAFTNLDPIAVPSSITSTLVLTNVTAAMNGNKYRVIITNSCSQSVTSNGTATLTVNAGPVVTATAPPATICLSDGPIALVGSPVGGSWSGIGVSGSNFIPSATAVGTYNLTYTYVNALGCPGTATVVAKVIGDADCGRLRLLRNNALIVYPNPSNGLFNFKVNSVLYNYVNMKVYNSAGSLLTTKNFTGLVYGQVVPIDLTYLPSGTYMVRFFYEGGVRTSEKVFSIVIGR